MTLADELNTVAEETKGGDRVKTADLVNLSFTINGYTIEDKNNKDGTPAVDDMGVRLVSYVGHIVLDGEDRDAWLDGTTVRPQLQKIRERNAFPVKVKLIKDEQRYVLRLLEDDAPAVREPIGKAALIAYMQRNAMTGSDVLRALGVDPGDSPQQAWSDYIEKVIALDGVKDEDGACAMILKTLSSTTPKPQAEAAGEIPFA